MTAEELRALADTLREDLATVQRCRRSGEGLDDASRNLNYDLRDNVLPIIAALERAPAAEGEKAKAPGDEAEPDWSNGVHP